ncbi:UNVERIFIED_CONTAM: hypothetical protein Slati_4264800 [Sesamum latifolium]|uniref:Uncharacterized protein n=1 Tax=Sesamum latifolium TaxID=2727402 RepID=A0AAW2TD38_9LAMI
MSAKSRRRMFMFGPVKFKPEMELSAIKQRQARRASTEKAAGNGGGTSPLGVVRSRSHLTSMLARSFGCIRWRAAAALRGWLVWPTSRRSIGWVVVHFFE